MKGVFPLLSIEGFQVAFKYFQLFEQGLVCTVTLSFLTVIFGFVLALILALMRLSGIAPLKFIASAYVEVFRATPLMVQLFLVYYVLLAGINLPVFKLFGIIRFERMVPGVIALALNSGAYLSEIIRSGIMAVDHGQMEAGRSLGLSYGTTMRSVILPQAFKNVLPALGNEFIVLLKETSVCGYIALQDLTKGGDIIRSQTYDAFLPLIAVALIYLIVVVCLSQLLKKLENRLKKNER